MSDLLLVTSYRWSTIASTKWASTSRQMALTSSNLTIIPYIPFTASPRFYKPEELQAFRETLMEEIRKRAPKALLVFGDHAFAALTGHYGGKRSIKYMRGFCLPSYAGVPCVGTFDLETFSKSEGRIFPQQSKLMGLIMSDISSAFSVSQGRISPCLDPSTEVRVHSGVDRLKELVEKIEADPTLLIAYDLETSKSALEDEDELYEFSRDEQPDDGDESNEDSPTEWDKGGLDTARAAITTVQFAIDDTEGYSVDWNSESIPYIKAMLNSANPKAGHNTWLFDDPILSRHGVEVSGVKHDTLWLWHSIQPDLPAHLQGVAQVYGWNFPWKHMAGSHFEFYGVVDVCAVQRIMSRLPADARALVASNGANAWMGYELLTREFHTLLKAVERRGIPVDRTQLNSFRQWLMEQVERFGKEIQPLIPLHLGSHMPPDGYAKLPDDIREGILTRHPNLFAPETKVCKNGSIKEIKSKLKWSDVYKWMQEDREEWHPEIAEALKLGYTQLPGGRFARKLSWNPRSTDQLKSYISFKGYPMPVRFKDGKATTGDKELDKLASKTGDPVIKLAREYRAHSKMINAYTGTLHEDGTIVGGWNPGPDGRLRTTFTFGPATWQLGARNPNVLTTPKRRAELAKKFRACIKAESGHKLVELDFRAYHARTLGLEAQDATYMRIADMDIHSFVTGHLVKWKGIETALDLSDTDLRALLGEIKKAHKFIRDFKAKPCIAEGELVLTSNGLKPIEQVQLTDKVWDGIDWVSHEGVVYQGIKQVAKYDGLWATIDHEVYTDDGRKIPFWRAASEMVGIIQSGNGGQAIRINRNHFAGDKTGGSIPKSLSKVSRNRNRKVDLVRCLKCWASYIIYQKWSSCTATCRSLGKAIRCYCCSLYKSVTQTLQELWRAGNTKSFQFSDGIYTMGGRKSTSSNLPYAGDRSDRQRWSLRTWEPSSSFSPRTNEESPNISKDSVSESVDSTTGLSKSLWLQSHKEISQARLNWRTDFRTARVYDILNAGPRKRFTVSNKLVANCILGIGFGMGARRMFFENRENFENETEAKRLLDLLKSLFPKVFAWQEAICQEADQRKMLISRWGAVRRFYEVFRWERTLSGWKPKGGKDAEKAKAFFPANDAHGMLRHKLLEMNSKGLLERWELINIIHDAVLFHPPASVADECIHVAKEMLEAPVTILADPVVCPDGFVCAAEASVGDDWADMEGV